MMTTILSCETIKEVPVIVYETIDPDFDSPPERSYLEGKKADEPLNEFLLKRVYYYSDLVKEWESWGIQVYEVVDQDLPESLKSAKEKTDE